MIGKSTPTLLLLFLTAVSGPLLLAQVPDLDSDGDVDRDDILVILMALNQPAMGGGDLRDVDGDGTITILDARKAALQCDRDLCATEDQQPPEVDLNGPAAGNDFMAFFLEGGGPAAITDPAATVTDPDMDQLASLTATLVNRPDGADEVLAANTAGTSIMAGYTPATGILLLDGPDTVANFQQVLRTVTYDNTAANPTVADRTVDFVAQGPAMGETSNTATSTVEITANIPPTISDIANQMLVEDQAPVVVNFTVDDPDGDANSLTVMVTMNSNPALVTAMLGGSGANRTVTLTPQPNQNGTSNLEITVTDPGGKTASDTFEVDVLAQADDPVLANGGALMYEEDDPPTAISPSLTVTEVDGENITGGTVTISPGTFQAAEDVLDCTPSGGVGCSFSGGTLTVNGTPAAAGVYETVLRSVTYENTNTDDPTGGQRDIAYQVTDESGAASNMLAATVDVVPVNDPPLAQADAYTTVGNTQIVGGAIDATLTPFRGPAFAEDADGVLTQGTADSDVDSATLTVDRAGADAGSLADIGPGTSLATSAGGTVRFDDDGTFVYTPPAGVKNSADSFLYEVCDDGAPTECDTAAVDVTIVDERIIYVDNTAPGGGDGSSDAPFNLLNDAEAASQDGDTIFVFEGDGTDTGQDQGITLKNGQILMGHSAASFMLGGVTITAPDPPATTANPPSDFPVVSNSSAGVNGVTVDATAADRLGVEIRGLDISGSSNAIDVTSGPDFAVSVLIDGNFINTSGAEGIDLNPDGSGAFSATVTNNQYATASPAGNGFDLSTSAGFSNTAILDFSNNSNVTSSSGTAVNIDGSLGTGGITITGFADNSVSGETGGAGVMVASSVFDAIPATADFDEVGAGAWTIGDAANAVGGAGMYLGTVSMGVAGNLAFDGLDVFSGGTGLRAVGTGSFATNSGFRLAVAAGTVEAAGAPAVDMDPLTAAVTLDSISSTGSSGGVLLTNVDGTVDINGGSISSSGGTAFLVDGLDPTVGYDGSIANSGGTAAALNNRTGGAVTFNGTITDTGGSGVRGSGNGGASVVQFNGAVALNTGASSGVAIDTSTGSFFFFNGGLDIDTTTATAFSAADVNMAISGAGNTIDATAAPALDLNTVGITAADVALQRVSSSNTGGSAGVTLDAVFANAVGITELQVDDTGAGNGVDILNSSSTITFGAASSIQNAGGTAFNVNGGTSDVTYAGDIANTSGLSISVNGTTAGLVEFTGVTTVTDSGDGIAINNASNVTVAKANLSSGAAVDIDSGVSGAGYTFSDLQMNHTAGAANAIDVNGGSATVSFTANNPGNIVSTTNRVLRVNGTSGGSVTVQSGAGMLVDNGGGGIEINDADSSVTVNNADLNGTQGISIANAATGAMTFNNVTVDPTAGFGFMVDGSVSSVTSTIDLNNVDITNPPGRVADIRAMSGGSVDFDAASSLSTNTGTGILVDGNGGGTSIAFNSSVKTISTGTNAAVTLTNNGGASVSFANGNLDIDATSGAGFTATGGGTVVVTGAVNTIDNTTATALNVANTNIGAAGLTFQRISSNGGSNPGIVLDSTGTAGGLAVTGAGGDCKNNAAQCSGGSILNKTGDTDGISLTSTVNVDLSHMNVSDNSRNGIFGTGVNGFRLNQSRFTGNADQAAPDEAAVHFVDSTGSILGGANQTRFDDLFVSNSHEHNVIIRNNSGTITNLAVSNSTFTNDGASTEAGNNFFIDAGGTANVTVNVTGSQFNGNTAPGNLTAFGLVGDAADTSSVTLNASTSSFSANNVALSASASNSGNVTFNFSNNPTITGSRSNAINVFANANHTGAISGRIENNTVGTNGVLSSGSLFGSGVRISNEGTGTVTALINNNTIQEVGDGNVNAFEGIFVNENVNGGTINATITGNTLDQIRDDRGINVQQVNGGGTVCSDISGNALTNIGSATPLRVRQVSGTHNVRQLDPAGPPDPNRLDTANGGVSVSVSGTINFNAGACPQP